MHKVTPALLHGGHISSWWDFSSRAYSKWSRDLPVSFELPCSHWVNGLFTDPLYKPLAGGHPLNALLREKLTFKAFLSGSSGPYLPPSLDFCLSRKQNVLFLGSVPWKLLKNFRWLASREFKFVSVSLWEVCQISESQFAVWFITIFSPVLLK